MSSERWKRRREILKEGQKEKKDVTNWWREKNVKIRKKQKEKYDKKGITKIYLIYSKKEKQDRAKERWREEKEIPNKDINWNF